VVDSSTTGGYDAETSREPLSKSGVCTFSKGSLAFNWPRGEKLRKSGCVREGFSVIGHQLLAVPSDLASLVISCWPYHQLFAVPSGLHREPTGQDEVSTFDVGSRLTFNLVEFYIFRVFVK
jgi:hypothetical protein